jgi:hypothetical protein
MIVTVFVCACSVPVKDFPVMMGEMDKVVPASSHRFTQTAAGEWTLSGAAFETVVISFAEDKHTLKTVSCVLGAAGTGKLSCAGETCKCI